MESILGKRACSCLRAEGYMCGSGIGLGACVPREEGLLVPQGRGLRMCVSGRRVSVCALGTRILRASGKKAWFVPQGRGLVCVCLEKRATYMPQRKGFGACML